MDTTSALTIDRRLVASSQPDPLRLKTSFVLGAGALAICAANIAAQSEALVLLTIMGLAALLVLAFLLGARVGILASLVVYTPFSLRLNLGPDFALPSDLLLFDLFFMLLIGDLFLLNRLRVRPLAFFTGAGLFLLVLILLTPFSSDIPLTLRKLFYVIQYLIVFTVVTGLARREDHIERIQGAAIAASTVVAASTIVVFILQLRPGFDIWQFRAWVPQNIIWLLQGYGPANEALAINNWIIFSGGRAIFRTFFPFINPMALGTYLLTSFAITLAYLLYSRTSSYRRFWRFSFAVIGLAVALSFARSIWLSAIVVAFLVVFVGPRGNITRMLGALRRGRLYRIVLVAALAFVLTALSIATVPALRERFASIGDMDNQSNLDRLYWWQLAITYFWQDPLSGAGLGVGTDKVYSHNAYLDFAMDTGAIGLTLFLFMFGMGLWEALVVRYRGQQSLLSTASIGWLAGLAGLMIHFFFDNEFFFPQNGVPIILLFALIRSGYLAVRRRRHAYRD